MRTPHNGEDPSPDLGPHPKSGEDTVADPMDLRAALTRKAFFARGGALGLGGAAAASLLAACGGGQAHAQAGSTTSGGGTTSAGTSTSAPSNLSGSAAKLRNKTIGVAVFTFADQNQQTLATALQDVSNKAGLNWTFKATDTQASQQQAQAAVSAFVTEKVDAIIDMVIVTSMIEAQLAQAKAAKIPVFGFYTFSYLDPNIVLDYAGVLAADAVYNTEYMFRDAQIRNPGKQTINLAILDTTLPVTQPRRGVINGLLPQFPNFRLAQAVNDVSLTSTASSTTQAVNDILTAHPDLNTIWTNYPPMAIYAAQAVAQAGKTDQVKVYGHVAGIDLVLSGQSPLVSTSWVDLVYTAWGLVDLMLKYFTGQAVDRLASWTSPVPATDIDATLKGSPEIVKVSSGGAKVTNWLFGGGSYRDAFLAKWRQQYGLG
jgi:ribose transport system substrate-binding protein